MVLKCQSLTEILILVIKTAIKKNEKKDDKQCLLDSLCTVMVNKENYY